MGENAGEGLFLEKKSPSPDPTQKNQYQVHHGVCCFVVVGKTGADAPRFSVYEAMPSRLSCGG